MSREVLSMEKYFEGWTLFGYMQDVITRNNVSIVEFLVKITKGIPSEIQHMGWDAIKNYMKQLGEAHLVTKIAKIWS